jgi:cytochrome c55X
MKSSTLTAGRPGATPKCAVLWVGAVLLAGVSPVLGAPLTAEQGARLDHLLRHDCGSCHGMTMKGGLGPALLPATLQDRDEDGLVQMILFGNPARAMPPWEGLLDEAEARWIVRRLKQGLNEREPKP